MFTNRKPLLAALLTLAALLSACGGGEKDGPETIVIKDTDWTPRILTTEQVVGKNRFVLGVLDRSQRPIVDANVRLKFYKLQGNQAIQTAEMDAPSRVPARDAGLNEQIEHIHADGSKHTHVNQTDGVGYYVVEEVAFDSGGNWGVEVTIDAKTPRLTGSQRIAFTVLEKSLTPAVGSPAPRSRNLTAADVTDIAEIDSSVKPSADMHTATIADGIAAGKPVLVLFAVPGYCASALCGPEFEIMKKLYPKYTGRAEFIHVEFYKDPGSPQRVPVEATKEWSLRTEPWFFVIDSRGIISAKFEGPATLKELDDALQKVSPNATN